MTHATDHDESATYAAARDRSVVLDALIDEHASTDPARFRMLTGDRPTGPLHIGHYLASLRNRVRLQDKGVETFVVIADYQVITDRDSVGEMGANVLGLVLDYLAAGLDPARTTIFTHSAVSALNQLMLPFLSLVTDAELRRNPTVKDELALSDGRPLSGLLLTYPVHQAADILFCHSRIVPVGRDQLPHLEQTRAIARRFNTRYAAGHSVFPEPEALLSEVPLLLGTDGTKMSKSKGNVVNLRDTADETAARIRAARTDSERRITFDPKGRPDVANLLTVAGLFLEEDPRVGGRTHRRRRLPRPQGGRHRGGERVPRRASGSPGRPGPGPGIPHGGAARGERAGQRGGRADPGDRAGGDGDELLSAGKASAAPVS